MKYCVIALCNQGNTRGHRIKIRGYVHTPADVAQLELHDTAYIHIHIIMNEWLDV